MKLKLSLSWISKTKISQWMEDCVVEYEVARSQIMSIYHLISYTCYTQRISVAHIFIFYSFFSPSLLSLCNGKKKAKLEKLFTNGCLTAHSTSRRRVKQTRVSEALKVYFRKKKQNQKKTERRKKMCRVGFRWKKCEISSIIFSNARTTNSTWITVSNYVNETSNSSLLGQREWIKIEKKSFRVY